MKVLQIHALSHSFISDFILFLRSFFASGVGFKASLSTLTFLHYYTMILQRIRIIVGDAGFEPGTSAPEFFIPHVFLFYFLPTSMSFVSLNSFVFFLNFL